MGHVRPKTPDIPIGNTVEIDGEQYINNGNFLQPLRGRSMENSLQTFSGHFMWPLEPRADEIDYISVAHGIACENRYGNQSPYPYPVAWHSVALSHVVPPHLAKAALIHDASEAYLKDIPRTIRRQEPFKSVYDAIEERLLRVCCEYFEVDYNLIDNDDFLFYDVKMSWSEMVVWSRMNPVYMAKMLNRGVDIEEAEDKTYIEWVEKCPRHNVWQLAEQAWLERYDELF